MTQGNEKQAISSKPYLYNYSDYRAFLRDWFAYLKETGDLSLREIARNAGLATGYLPSVLAGKIPLTTKALQKLERQLGLGEPELRFLELLRRVSESDDHGIRIDALAKIQRHQEFRQKNPKEFEVFQYLTDWVRVAIREMAALKDFAAEPDRIRKRLKGSIPLQRVRDALEFLREHGFLTIGKNGKIEFPEKNIQCVETVYRTALRQFHRQALLLAGEALDTTPVEQRYVVGHTVAISSRTYPKIQEILERALQEVATLTRAEKGADEVYHVALAAFPMTERRKQGGNPS